MASTRPTQDATLPPLLTADLPGIGGSIKAAPEDFQVEEIPAYEPSGNGEHLYLWIEKTGLGHEYFLKLLARKLNIPIGEIGTAGMKDRHAITRQWVSVPARAESQLDRLEGEGIRVLTVTKHTNKLRAGHLRGNRFTIRIRDVAANALILAAPILEQIRNQGLPNYYGPQRFGHDGETARLGLAMLRRERTPRVNPFLRKLALSAAQSFLFNDAVAQRLTDGAFRSVLPGDVMMKWPAGGMFVAEDIPTEQTRFENREIVTGGPMFGAKMYAAQAEAAAREAALLDRHQLTPETFAGFGKLLAGTRRHNLIYLDDLQAEEHEGSLAVQFQLPAGSYATVLLRELMKVEPADTGESPSTGED